MYISIDLSIKSAGVAVQYTNKGKPYTILYSPTEYKINKEKCVYGEINKSELCILLIENDIIEKFKEQNLDLKEYYFKRIRHNIKLFLNTLNKIVETVKPFDDDKVMKFSIEGFSFGSSQGMSYNIAEFAGVIKYYIEETYNTSITVIPPTTIKKFAVKGNATKEEMVNAAMEKSENLRIAFEDMKGFYLKKKSEKNPLYESPFNDLVDAWFQLECFKEMEKNAETGKII